MQNSVKVKKEDTVTISYYINDICVYEFNGYIIEKENTLTNCQEFSLVIKTSDEPPLTITAILKEWVKGNDVLYWKNNKCIEAKNLWLTASLYWQQIFPPEQNKILNASLNLEGVNNYLDFFCMLGEAFWGKRGYIGRDFHGFDDLLSDLSYEKSEINIYIENTNKLRLFLERISPPDCNYYDTFMRILVDRKCNINKK
ncbi:barstar family protein [Xenorhabdus bovienii]|nr:barstar family protein [Xenorhabdus bovienii]MDE9446353.1 barstar family protein [Xenorhabdus bovienii]